MKAKIISQKVFMLINGRLIPLSGRNKRIKLYTENYGVIINDGRPVFKDALGRWVYYPRPEDVETLAEIEGRSF